MEFYEVYAFQQVAVRKVQRIFFLALIQIYGIMSKE